MPDGIPSETYSSALSPRSCLPNLFAFSLSSITTLSLLPKVAILVSHPPAITFTYVCHRNGLWLLITSERSALFSFIYRISSSSLQSIECLLSEVQTGLQNCVCLSFSFLKFVALIITVSFELPSASYQPTISCDLSFFGLVQVVPMILSIDLSVFVLMKRKLLVCVFVEFLAR